MSSINHSVSQTGRQGSIFLRLLLYWYLKKKLPFLADFIKNWVHFIKNSDVISLVIYQSQPKLHWTIRYKALWKYICILGCFSKDTLKKNKKPNPVRNWGAPRENISRRRGWSNKSRGSLKTLEVWQKCMLDKTSHLFIIRQTAAEQGLRKLIIDIILTIVWYWVINFLKKMFKNATGWSHGVRKAFLGGWRQAQ